MEQGKSAQTEGGGPVAARVDGIFTGLRPCDARLLRDFIAGLLERIDPRGQRDAAIRRSAALLGQVAPSARTKALEGELLRCLSTAWLSPPADASPLRKELHRIGPLTGGDGLSWRRLVEIIEAS